MPLPQDGKETKLLIMLKNYKQTAIYNMLAAAKKATVKQIIKDKLMIHPLSDCQSKNIGYGEEYQQNLF